MLLPTTSKDLLLQRNSQGSLDDIWKIKGTFRVLQNVEYRHFGVFNKAETSVVRPSSVYECHCIVRWGGRRPGRLQGNVHLAPAFANKNRIDMSVVFGEEIDKM